MQSEEQLAHCLGFQYEVRVRRVNAKFELFLPELNLRSSHEDLATAYAQLDKRREEWIRELAAEGLWSWIVPPSQTSCQVGGVASSGAPTGTLRVEQGFGGFKLFLAKTAVVLVLLLSVGGLAVRGISGAGYSAEKNLDGIVNWPEEKVVRYTKHARDIVTKLKPIFDEIAVLFDRPQQRDDNSAAPAVQPEQTSPQP